MRISDWNSDVCSSDLVQFAIVDGRIVVDQRSPQTDQADRDNIISALEHICSSGDQLISNLDNSNCDRRLIDSVKELQDQLTSDGNIVKIGLTNMACCEIGRASCRERVCKYV